MTIIEALMSKTDLLFGHGVSETEIINAEQELQISFSEDFKDYLSHFGIAAFGGHELMGITSSSRVNVVDVTINERKLNSYISNDMYVIEVSSFEGMVFWQKTEGAVFCSLPNQKPIYVCQSLTEYVLLDKF